LPEKGVLEVEDKFLYLIHSIDELDLDPAAAEFDAIYRKSQSRFEILRSAG
jgi:hypothetical protein